MPEFPGTHEVVYNPLRPRSLRFASFALKAVKQGHRNHTSLGAMTCWLSVVEAARLSGAISDRAAANIRLYTTREHWSPFVPFGTDLVMTREQFLSIPAGSFIAFLTRPQGNEVNPEQNLILAHAMVSIGQGRAVGSNNLLIGGRPDWSEVDLSTLSFTMTAGQFVVTLEHGRNCYIRYRNIEDTERRDCVVM